MYPAVLSRLQALGYRKVLTQWIPHVLADDMRLTQVSIDQPLLLCPQREKFLEDLITGDEIWVVYEIREEFGIHKECYITNCSYRDILSP
ncbi:hypothetical protein Y032_0290g1545 [Ancylostoma ceylanicum]|uniref:Uncharacterized protein n=1 Tax=Ancylostoma ceylanicum TaxID=53326 RepID=A0A016S583_9BILA|nr:hypothetical protein Y032_0290g1545 [Ancylostoma ceylanicum]